MKKKINIFIYLMICIGSLNICSGQSLDEEIVKSKIFQINFPIPKLAPRLRSEKELYDLSKKEGITVIYFDKFGKIRDGVEYFLYSSTAELFNAMKFYRQELEYRRDLAGLRKECLVGNVKSVKGFYELADSKYPRVYADFKNISEWQEVKKNRIANQNEMFMAIEKNSNVIRFLWNEEYKKLKDDKNLLIFSKPNTITVNDK